MTVALCRLYHYGPFLPYHSASALLFSSFYCSSTYYIDAIVIEKVRRVYDSFRDFFCYLAGKWNWKSKLGQKVVGLAQSDHFYNEKTKMMTDFDPSSGSGAGEAVLVQRTIGLDLTRFNLVGKGRYGEVWRANYHGSQVAVKVCI